MTEEPKPLIRWGIIGLGKIARKMASDLQLLSSASIHAVASRSAKKARDFAFEFGAEKSFHDYQALCEDPEVDVVYIATPHSFHFEQASMALEAGKAVLVEKPMGINLNQSKALVAKARDKGLFLMEGIWTRFIPITEKLIDLLKAEVIGEIEYLEADFGFRPPYDPHGRLFNPALGGGSLLDIGIYPLYLSLISLGKAQESKVQYRLSESGVDQYCAMELSYPSGAKANLLSSFESKTPTEAYLKGNKGSIKLHSRFHHSERLTIETGGRSRDINLAYQGEGYFHEIEEVNQCLQAGLKESPKMSLKKSLELATMLEEIRQQIYKA